MKYAKGGQGPIGALKYDIVPFTRGAVLEIGRGPFKVWPHFIAVRERSDNTIPPTESVDRWVDDFNQGLADFRDGTIDAIVVHPGIVIGNKLADELIRVCRDGAHLVRFGDGPGDLIVETMVAGTGFLAKPADTYVGKRACVVRYGAIGDTLQTAAILATLKRQGYHVTFACHPTGEELLRHDPHIDGFLVQDKDQVPNIELPYYWAHLASRFDRFVNLSESVEGTLLFQPGRPAFAWPKAVRHSLANRNYQEFMAAIADLPFEPAYHFVPTDDEIKRADAFIEELGRLTNPNWILGQRWVRPFVVMWALSGSSVHKTYPHQDAVIARILAEIPQAHVVTVGDHFSRILEAGWENESRVHRRCGELEIRDTITLAQRCDLVIGPETGVLNAVAFEPNHKVVLLSHSTAENLTKHWVNTEALHSEVTPCYPCHQMHYVKDGWRTCTKHEESSTAQCQWDIPPADVWAAVQRAFIAATSVRRLLETA